VASDRGGMDEARANTRSADRRRYDCPLANLREQVESFPPVLFGLTAHRRRRRVLALEPIRRAARSIARSQALRDGSMSFRLGAAALAASISIALSSAAFPRGEWPDGPNKAWFENLQRPDNHLHPYRKLDPKSLCCCGEADVVKTKFKVESNGGPHPGTLGTPGSKNHGSRFRRRTP
jgi:hypothetical protein